MTNTLEIIIESLMKNGYTEEQAGDLIKDLIEEQKALDKIRDIFCDLLHN